MEPKTMQRMRDHITKSEGTLLNPYKDTKGKLTVGTGFLVDDEKSFVAMPFEIKDAKTGELRPATEAEKKVEFKRAREMSNTQLREKATKSPLSLPKNENDRRLDSEITTRVDKIKTEIGEADWNKLTDGQKTAMLDVHYANGDLSKYPKLKEAIKKGDTREMANQSDFHGGQIEGTDHQHRNFDRLRRNKAEMQGIDPESDEAYRQVADSYPDHPSLPENYKKHRNLSVLRPEPRPQPESGPANEPPTPPSPQPTPEPTPAPESATPSPQPQPTPAPEQNVSQSPADPQVASMLEMAAKPIDNPGQAALLKPVEKLTQPEMMEMIHSAQGDYRGWRSGDPLKAHTYEKVQDWHVNIYGDGPQGNDGGKPIEPTPIRPIPEQPSPHATPQGEDLWQATARIGQKVADAAGSDGYADAVKGLQRGLNILGEANPLPPRSPAYGPYTKLGQVDEDGRYGPQTDFALKHATARLGPDKVDEAFALGRFNAFARQAQRNGNPEGLEDKTHAIFGPLFRDSADSQAPKVEGGVLQKTLNDIGGRSRDDWEPLKVDSWVGPKTTEAFRTVLQDEDADQITRSFGRGLGLL